MYSRKRLKPARKKYKTQTKFNFDWSLLFITLTLLIIGVIMVYEASVVVAFQQFNDKLYFARRQLQWSILGLFAMGFATFIPLQSLKKYTFHFFALTLALLVVVLFSNEISGAKRWLDLGFFSLQPSELVKLSLILYLSAYFEKSTKTNTFLLILGSVIGLVMLQPDLDTAIIITCVSLGIYFLAEAPISHILGLVTAAIGGAGLLVVSSPYRFSRLMTFLDINRDPLGASYHIRQVILALGSGGVLGSGFGRSLQKYRFLPEATTDSIFAVIGEETGFIGAVFIVSLFLFYAYKGYKIAERTNDKYLRLIASGLTLLITSQAFLNISAMTALVPIAGITLPFISYGGSSLIISLTATGLLINISRYRDK